MAAAMRVVGGLWGGVILAEEEKQGEHTINKILVYICFVRGLGRSKLSLF